MVGTPAPTVTIPALYTSLLTNLAQKGFTVLFAMLLAHGVFVAGQQTQFVEIGVSLALGAVSIGWTYVATRLNHERQHALATQPPPTVVEK